MSALPSTVGVIGGGRMGAGIAHAHLVAGVERVIVLEIDQAGAEAARTRIEADIAASIERGKLSGTTADHAARLDVVTEAGELAPCGLVIEAVPEDAGLKRDALTRAEAVIGEEAWLASNTSSLSITELAASLADPSRLCGLHFFNPVPASKLIEVVLADATAPALAAAAPAWVEALGKAPVVVRDAPGFASSRLGVAIGLEAIRMVEEGVAEPADIDRAMVLGYKHPVGPLALTDIVGLDVRLGIAEHLHAELGERFAPPALLREKVARGELGRKSGRGFYDYS